MFSGNQGAEVGGGGRRVARHARAARPSEVVTGIKDFRLSRWVTGETDLRIHMDDAADGVSVRVTDGPAPVATGQVTLAAAYAAHVMDHSSAYGYDGAFATGMEFRQGHFHSRAVTMLGVIRYGHATGDQKALAWGRRVFEWARAQGTSFGWYPERLVESRAHGAETCAIVDRLFAMGGEAAEGQGGAFLPLLLFGARSFIGGEPNYYSSLVLTVAIDLFFDPTIGFNILLIGA